MQFIVGSTSAELVNTLRRAAIFNVPTLAIEDVYFVENSSALYDEQISARLGLLVLKAKSDKLKPLAACSCKGKGCKLCQAKFVLKEEGPKMVYAKDLTSEGAEILHPATPIIWLDKYQKIDLTATAAIGVGSDHAKWNTGLFYYHHFPNIKIKNATALKKLLSNAPFKQVFDNKLNIKTYNYDLCMLCGEKSNSAVEVTPAKNKFVVYVESWGSIEPIDILKKAANVVKEEIGELKLK